MKLGFVGLSRSVLFGLACAACGLAPSLRASVVTNVNVGDDYFSPAVVAIHAGDQVKWTWVGSIDHSSTSDSRLWDSGIKGRGFTFTNLFANAGSYPYLCTLHSFLGQTGTITVQAQMQVPPAVAISSPTNGATFWAPWSGAIQFSASASGGTVAKVEFFAGTNQLGTLANPPSGSSTFQVTNLAAGGYTLTAMATDNTGASGTSAGVAIQVVTPAPILLSQPQRLPGAFGFSFTANPGLSYVINRSANLGSWTPLSTNLASGTSISFLDNGAGGPNNFYSVRLQPNP
jgi:plastocyanin